MKSIKNRFFAVMACIALATGGCKDDSGDSAPSATDSRLTELMNNGVLWTLSSQGVTKDGFDVSDQFAGFKLNIGNKVYNTINGKSPVWETSGSWDFIDNNPNQLLRDGSTQISISLSGGNLALTFMADGVSQGGRSEAVSGEYIFHLVSE